MTPNLTKEEALLRQYHLDKISQSAAMLNKLGVDVTDIMGEVRYLNRQAVIDSATHTSQLPEMRVGTICK